MTEALLYLECHNDEALARGLGLRKAMIAHAGCKGRVSSALRRAAPGSIGLVDEDPGQPVDSFLDSFETVESARFADLRSNGSAQKWLIVIKPRLEEMLVTCGNEAPALWKAHRLPSSASELHKFRRSQTERITAFVTEAGAIQQGPLHRLRTWLSASLGNRP